MTTVLDQDTLVAQVERRQGRSAGAPAAIIEVVSPADTVAAEAELERLRAALRTHGIDPTAP